MARNLYAVRGVKKGWELLFIWMMRPALRLTFTFSTPTEDGYLLLQLGHRGSYGRTNHFITQEPIRPQVRSKKKKK